MVWALTSNRIHYNLGTAVRKYMVEAAGHEVLISKSPINGGRNDFQTHLSLLHKLGKSFILWAPDMNEACQVDIIISANVYAFIFCC
jgi:hypothetical protein